LEEKQQGEREKITRPEILIFKESNKKNNILLTTKKSTRKRNLTLLP
jgi:hypothetical protein